MPEGSAAYFDHLDRGLAASGRDRGDLDVCQGAEVAFLDDEDEVAAHVASRKKELAFSIGGMGSASTNFYNDAYSRQGWAEVAAADPRALAGWRPRWCGRRWSPTRWCSATTLIGTEQMVRERLRVWRDAGVNTVRLYPAGDTLDHRLDTLGRAIDLVKTIG